MEAIEILCAAGANINQRNKDGRSPLDMFSGLRDSMRIMAAKVLIANGVRIGKCDVTQELRDFERGVLRCRSIVVSFLRVKKTGKADYRWCRYLLREVAFAVWASRYDVKWGI